MAKTNQLTSYSLTSHLAVVVREQEVRALRGERERGVCTLFTCLLFTSLPLFTIIQFWVNPLWADHQRYLSGDTPHCSSESSVL